MPGLLLLPGLRIDRLRDRTDHRPAPHHRPLGAGEEDSPPRAAPACSSRGPTPIRGRADEEFGNPWLSAERAQHYSLGFEWKPREYLTLDWTGFYKRLDQLVSSTDDVINEGGSRGR